MTDSLHIQRLVFRDFRNYHYLELGSLSDLCVFIGKNAVGKTNILEGLQLLTSAESFRHPQIMHMIKEGEKSSYLSIEITDGYRLMETALHLEEGKKRFKVNDKNKTTAEIKGLLPSVIFTPDDLNLVKRSSSVKRDALDALGSQLNRSYYIVRNDFEKIIRYKNRLLKEEAPSLLIESINETLITCGSQLFCFRRALFDRLIVHITKNYEDIAQSAESFSAEYIPSWQKLAMASNGGVGREASWFSNDVMNDRELVKEVLERNLSLWLDEERRRHHSLVGPHNDQITYMLGNKDAASFASQGQQRSIALSWKLAEVALIKEIVGVSPVLLLDDVLSELDEQRREMLVGFVTEDIQTFITATDLSGFKDDFIDSAKVIALPID